jgi:hypothetical protein
VKPDASILDANLERLLRRAYEPVHATAEFRERVGGEFVAAVGELGRRRERARSQPRPPTSATPTATAADRSKPSAALRWGLAAAALVLVFLSRGLFTGSTPGGASLEQILASGAAALRTTEQGPWSAVEASDELAHVSFEGAFLELATPASLPAQVAFANSAVEERWSIFPASHVRLERATTTEALDAHLLRGGFVARRAGDAPAPRRVESAQGAAEFRGAFDVRFALEAPEDADEWESCSGDPSTWLHVSVRRGAATAATGAASGATPREFGPGDEVFVCNGAALERREEAASSAPDRTQVDGQEPETSTPTGAERAPILRASVVADGVPIQSFEVVVLRSLTLPQVATPIALEFASAAGEFELHRAEAGSAGLEDGEHTVFVKAPGFALARLELAVRPGAATQTARIELERGARVEGLVLDAQTGRPIEGAYVVGETDSQLAVLSIDPEQNESFAHSTTTRAGGDFALERLSRGSHSLRASAPGYGQTWLEVRDLAPGEVRAGVKFTLRAAGALAGVVLDDQEQPVEGAVVLASTTDFERLRPNLTYASTTTDAEGRYRLDNLGEGAWAVLNFGARPMSGAPVYRFARVVAGETTALDFRPTTQTRALVGRVLNADGTPAARRTLMVGSSEEYDGPGDERWMSTNTDANGAFRAKGLSPGRHSLYIAGSTPAEMMSVGTVEVGEGATTEHDVVLGGVELRGRVLDGENAQALPFAVVLVIDRTGGAERFHGRVFASADGAYRFAHLAPGVYDVFVYATRGEYGQEQRLGLVVDGGSDLDEVDFTLYAGGRMAVRVGDEAGAPLSAELRFVDEKGARVQFSDDDRTADTGRLTVRGLKPGEWTVTAHKPGFEPATGRVRVHAGERAELELVLKKP